jgi:hypothetical protein
MSKTHFSGPVKVGTNQNNTGWVVNAASDTYAPDKDGAGTADEVGTIKVSSIVIPINSQIVDVSLNVESSFNNRITRSFTPTGTGATTIVTTDSDALVGIDPGSATTGGGWLHGGANVLSVSSEAPWTVTLSEATTGATGAQDVTFASGKYLNVGTSTGESIDNIIDRKLVTLNNSSLTATSILKLGVHASVLQAWDDIQGGGSGIPSRTVYFGFVDYSATKSTTGRIRVIVQYAQNVNLK